MITDLSRVNSIGEAEAGQEALPAKERTPEQIGAEIRMYVDVGRRVTLLCGIEIGRRLVEAKELLSHGEWLPWLQRETDFSERSAQNYMKVFNEYGAAQLGLFGPETNTQTFADLPISKALALISVSESEREEFAEAVDAENISVRELEEKIRERERQIEETEKAKQDAEELLKTQDDMLADMKKQIEELAKLNDELEHRPVEVAVETVRDEEAIAAAAKEAREKAEAAAAKQENRIKREHDKTLKELHAKLEAAQAERDSLKELAENSGAEAEKKLAEAEREAERIRAELEEARKRLKTSDADVAKFGVWFKQVQKDFDEMMETVRSIRERDDETADKLLKASSALLKKLLERMEPRV